MCAGRGQRRRRRRRCQAGGASGGGASGWPRPLRDPQGTPPPARGPRRRWSTTTSGGRGRASRVPWRCSALPDQGVRGGRGESCRVAVAGGRGSCGQTWAGLMLHRLGCLPAFPARRFPSRSRARPLFPIALDRPPAFQLQPAPSARRELLPARRQPSLDPRPSQALPLPPSRRLESTPARPPRHDRRQAQLRPAQRAPVPPHQQAQGQAVRRRPLLLRAAVGPSSRRPCLPSPDSRRPASSSRPARPAARRSSSRSCAALPFASRAASSGLLTSPPVTRPSSLSPGPDARDHSVDVRRGPAPLGLLGRPDRVPGRDGRREGATLRSLCSPCWSLARRRTLTLPSPPSCVQAREVYERLVAASPDDAPDLVISGPSPLHSSPPPHDPED